ncbi:MAG: SDR family NAD(P)-dependent oxidoreductase [Alphaproteobacteria bacterium]|nr:SDR family NAD(P)-dependent oxidoreductase [Alphaproteobacteria bacterium]
MARLVAVTGATGFLGRHVVRSFLDAGWRVRILTRRDPVDPAWRPHAVEAVPGDLDAAGALHRLVAGADTVVHAAGLIKARRDSAFHAVNAGGAQKLAEAMRTHAPEARMLLVSSLAAREPHLSPYAASKRAGEEVARTLLGERLAIVRPTAIYGPGDQETFQFIAAAAKGWPLPLLHPAARLTMVHVADVAAEIRALADAAPRAAPHAVADARGEGYSWREVAAAVAAAVGTKPRFLRVPAAGLRLVGWAGSAAQLLGRTPIATPGKMRELLHPDWSISGSERSRSGHVPVHGLAGGLADTVAWARREGWLR